MYSYLEVNTLEQITFQIVVVSYINYTLQNTVVFFASYYLEVDSKTIFRDYYRVIEASIEIRAQVIFAVFCCLNSNSSLAQTSNFIVLIVTSYRYQRLSGTNSTRTTRTSAEATTRASTEARTTATATATATPVPTTSYAFNLISTTTIVYNQGR